MADARPRRIGRILCPTDFSRLSASAVALAVEVARAQHAEIDVVHVVESSRPEKGGDPRVELMRLVTQTRLRGASVSGVILHGDVVGRILEHARAWPADLLVMGTHDGRRGQDWALGSVTERVLRRSPCPVLVTAFETEPGEVVRPRRILCPSDFSGASQAALEYAAVLAQGFGARITLLHVLEWFPGHGDVTHLHIPEYQMDVAQEAIERLRRSVPPGARALCSGETVVAVGRPHREIVRVARERQADLILLGIHRGRTLDRALGGSTVGHVVRETRCPLLAVPVDAADATDAGSGVVAHGRAS
jgi:nucleotide-binding universal stress UspA family protein